MDFCWVDETRWPGPDEEPVETFAEVFARLKAEIFPITNVFNGFNAMLDRLYKAEVPYEAYWDSYEEVQRKKELEAKAFTKADKALKVPPGTTENIQKYFDAYTERERKRQIGRGNVASKGPRPATTYGVKGRKAY